LSGRLSPQADKLLADIQAEFPALPLEGSSTNWRRVIGGNDDSGDPQLSEPPPAVSIAELEDRKTRVLARLNALPNEEKFKAARAYLTEQGILLRDRISELRADEAEAIRQETEAQENRDFVAAEADIAPLREKLNARLSAGFLPLDVRENTRQAFLDLAIKNRERAKEAGSALQDGCHVRAIFEARAEFYEDAAERLAPFDSTKWNLNREPSLSSLDKTFWDSGEAVSQSNLAFRTKQEKALIVYVQRRWYENAGNFVALAGLPNFPPPIVVPDKPTTPLERIQEIEQEQCLAALQPLHYDSINETIYSVETADFEHPHNKPLLLWPDGREVKVGIEVLYDRKARGYRRMPEPTALQANWSTGGQRYEAEQNEYGDWVKVPVSNGPQESWSQDAAGNWRKDSSLNGDWQLQPLLRVIPGDHKPPAGDPRQCFSNGSWWEKSDIERANQTTFNIRLAATMPESRTVADQIAVVRDETIPLSDEEKQNCWRKHEQSQKNTA